MYLDGITDFIFAEDQPEEADVIFVPGGSYPEAAENAAKLYHEGYAPYICPSGKYGKLAGHFQAPETDRQDHAGCGHGNEPKGENTGEQSFETEWDYLKNVLVRNGVPEQAILMEREATFTWENAIFSRKVCEKKGIDVKTAILSCQNWHARRCLMYYGQQFPHARLLVCPVSTRGITRDNWYLDPVKADLVLSEVERCGAQFHEIVRHFGQGQNYQTPDDWKSPSGKT